MAIINGGELVLRALRAAGVDTIFGLHGAHVDTIFQAARDHGMPVVDTRHEAAAGHAAEGFARTSRRLGVALVTAGGGFTNVITPLANAFLDRTPILVITGSGALRDTETNTLQAGIDQVAVATPITKWAHRIIATDQIPRLIAQAIRIATTGPRGPVLIDIPWDILTGEVDEDAVVMPTIAPVQAGPQPSPDLVAQVCELLEAAERPVIAVGSEMLRADGMTALHQLARHTGIPVFADYEGGSLLSGLGDHSGGFIQNLYTFGDDRPDAVLLLGVRFGLHTWHGQGLLIPHDATVIQVDPDAREHGRLQSVTLALTADPASTALALAKETEQGNGPDRTAWRRKVGQFVAERQAACAAMSHDRLPVHPWHAVQAIAELADENTIVVADGAESYLWLTETIGAAQPAAFLTHGYLGSMGVGFGNAIGAQKAAPDKRVLFVVGDGSVGYSIAEFDSLVRHALPVIVIVLNNRSWGATLHFQEMVGGANAIINTRLENGDYEKVAEAFGADAYNPETLDEFRAAIRTALAKPVPACINLRIDLDAIPPEEMVLMGRDPF